MRPDRLLPPPFLAALFAVLLLRALVPSGFMPGSDGWVQLCSFDGARWVLDADSERSAGHDRCFWDQALSAALVPAGFSGVASAPRPVSVASYAAVPDSRPVRTRPPARAPPFS